jgi:hypothetical protein
MATSLPAEVSQKAKKKKKKKICGIISTEEDMPLRKTEVFVQD